MSERYIHLFPPGTRLLQGGEDRWWVRLPGEGEKQELYHTWQLELALEDPSWLDYRQGVMVFSVRDYNDQPSHNYDD